MKSAVRSLAPVSVAPAVLAATLALCLVSFALPARAASLTQDQLSSIQSLLSSYGVSDAKINAVTAVLSDNGQSAASTMASSSPCAAPARALVRGMRSSDVTTLQERLSEDGYLSQDDISGFFGSTTEAALKEWQATNGVVASGTPETTGWGAVGQKTIQALGKCEMRKGEHGDNRSGDASSTPSTSPRGERGDHQPLFPGGSGTPVPQAASDQGAAVATVQFLADYSDAFNQNMAAVASAPIDFYVPILSDFFYTIGVR